MYQVLREQLLEDPLVGDQPDFARQHMGKVCHAARRADAVLTESKRGTEDMLVVRCWTTTCREAS